VSAPTLKTAKYTQLKEYDFDPALIPSAEEDVVATGATSGVYVDLITIANPTASSVDVAILDKQSVPKAILDVTVAANTTYVIKLYGYWAPGGVSWSASTNNVLVGYMRIWR
jgi:hypothetical protein